MSFSPHEKRNLLNALRKLTVIVEEIEEDKKCESCIHWTGVCTKANSVPPDYVQERGCEQWEFNECPF